MVQRLPTRVAGDELLADGPDALVPRIGHADVVEVDQPAARGQVRGRVRRLRRAGGLDPRILRRPRPPRAEATGTGPGRHRPPTPARSPGRARPEPRDPPAASSPSNLRVSTASVKIRR